MFGWFKKKNKEESKSVGYYIDQLGYDLTTKGIELSFSLMAQSGLVPELDEFINEDYINSDPLTVAEIALSIALMAMALDVKNTPHASKRVMIHGHMVAILELMKEYKNTGEISDNFWNEYTDFFWTAITPSPSSPPLVEEILYSSYYLLGNEDYLPYAVSRIKY